MSLSRIAVEPVANYREGAEALVSKLIPEGIENLDDSLPLIRTSELLFAPCNLSIMLLCKYRQNVCQFFYEMISRWLIPYQRAHIEVFFASDVRIPHLSPDLLSVGEIVVSIKSHQQLEATLKNWKQLEGEIRMGVLSHYHAKKISEFKGLSGDGKTAMIQEKIGSLIQSRSKDFERGIFSEMQHFLVNSPEDFKKIRDYHHISRIISNLYSIRNALSKNKEAALIKFLKTRVHDRPVLGMLAGLSLQDGREVFEKEHLFDAVRHYMPCAREVDGSYFADKNDKVRVNYLEIEKEDGAEFTPLEIQLLRNHVPERLRTHRERLRPALFMPRNEEEVLRNIKILSQELSFVTDIPQIIVTFQEERQGDLFFTVILLRVMNEASLALSDCFTKAKSPFRVTPDRIRRMGPLGRKHYKEATVFRVNVKSSSFVRCDRSVDLNQARKEIVSELVRVMGEVRDYNGGMLSKESELLSLLKGLLGQTARAEDLLLEQFFYGLSPVEMKSVMDVDQLEQFFLLLLQSQTLPLFRKKMIVKKEEKRIYAILPQISADVKERIKLALKEQQLPPYQLISFSIDLPDGETFGLLLQNEDSLKQQDFLALLSQY
jgi:hypothetical protein